MCHDFACRMRALCLMRSSGPCSADWARETGKRKEKAQWPSPESPRKNVCVYTDSYISLRMDNPYEIEIRRITNARVTHLRCNWNKDWVLLSSSELTSHIRYPVCCVLLERSFRFSKYKPGMEFEFRREIWHLVDNGRNPSSSMSRWASLHPASCCIAEERAVIIKSTLYRTPEWRNLDDAFLPLLWHFVDASVISQRGAPLFHFISW